MPNYRVIAPYPFISDVPGVPPTTWEPGCVYEIPASGDVDEEGNAVPPNPANFELTTGPVTPLDENRRPAVDDEEKAEAKPAKGARRGRGARGGTKPNPSVTEPATEDDESANDDPDATGDETDPETTTNQEGDD